MRNIKKYFFLPFILLLLYSTCIHADELSTVQATPANDFLRTIGINTSVNSRGENINSTIECVKYLGARYIRAGVPDGVEVRLAHYRRLYEECNARFSVLLPSNGDPSGIYPGGIPYIVEGAKEMLEKIAPDAIIGFEGCNEPNNWGILYQGEYGGGNYGNVGGGHSWKPLARYHRDFYSAVRAEEAFDGIPVWTASDVGAAWENAGMHFLEIPEGAIGVDPEFPAGTKFADVACVHNYFSGHQARSVNHTWRAAGIDGNNSLKSNFGVTWNGGYQGYTDEQLETLRKVTTETGTTLGDLSITEDYQGRTYLSCYLAQFVRGFEYTAIYILKDRVDEGGNQTFGFYAPGYKPRLAAHYLHNMTSVLKDDTSISNPGTLTYGLSSSPDYLHELLLQKNDGTMVLVIWGENYARGATADNITVTFGETFNVINVYNPAQYDENDTEIGKRPIDTFENTNTIDIAVLDHPLIIEIDPKPTVGVNFVQEEAKARVFPTMTEDMLHIQSRKEIDKLEVISLSGKVVYEKSESTKITSVDLSPFPEGAYLVKLTSADRTTEVHKIVKL